MTAKLKPVPTTSTAAYPPRYKEQPALMYPDSAHNRTAYIKALKFLRRGPRSLWVMDHPVPKVVA